MPRAVAARPRDARGYPIPAVTPIQDGEPRFALTDHERDARCARERLCSVCGLPIPPGPVWRVVDAQESAAIVRALKAGRGYRNMAPTFEAPGHRACMLYASMTCPYLARPNARRGVGAQHAEGLTEHAQRGAVRGADGAVAGFGQVEYAVNAQRVYFRFLDVVEHLPHSTGFEHLAALEEEIAREAGLGSCPGPDLGP